MSTTQSLRTRLDALHADYVESINQAIAADQDDEVAALAASYDQAATLMVAQHEGKTHLLPLHVAGRVPVDTTSRRWFRRTTSAKHAA